MMTSLFWCHQLIEHSVFVYYFRTSNESNSQVTNSIGARKNKQTQEVIVTSLNAKHYCFVFLTYHPSLFKRLSFLSASIFVPNAKNDAGCFSSHWRTTDCTFALYANFCSSTIFLHQKYTVCVVKHCRDILDACISKWIRVVLSIFAHKTKKNILFVTGQFQ